MRNVYSLYRTEKGKILEIALKGLKFEFLLPHYDLIKVGRQNLLMSSTF